MDFFHRSCGSPKFELQLPAFPLITCGSHKGIDRIRRAPAERWGDDVLEQIMWKRPSCGWCFFSK